jgi:prophage antirepressor-like protein
MSDIVPFRFDEHPIRVQQEDGAPWFCANDVCEALGHSNGRKALADLVHEDDVTSRDAIDSMGRTQATNFVNESGLYALIFGSRLESAKRFKRWVTHEVLPTLRKTGRYEAPRAAPTDDVKLLTAKRLESKERRLSAELLLKTLRTINKVKPLHPDVFVATAAVAAETAAGRDLPALKPATLEEWYTPTQIADRLGVSAHRIGRVITELGIRGNVEGTARAVINKAAHSEKTITSYQYSPKAVEMIEAKLSAEPVHDA